MLSNVVYAALTFPSCESAGVTLNVLLKVCVCVCVCVCVSQYSSPEVEEEGKKRYESQKMERFETKERNGELINPVSIPGNRTAGFHSLTGL